MFVLNASQLSQQAFNATLTRYIFERAAQGYIDDTGGKPTSPPASRF